ncbi:unnamed protein product [Cuscuta campestris]|uniref:Uncharacterized protein n=1 Tax=Cuscuta campestris TaxID=132261 RepID=A0A484NCD8_9ASTE|nr:unnamed protein product [Cuscuta campestris]
MLFGSVRSPSWQYLFNDEGQEHASGEIPQNTDDINNNVRNNGQYPSKWNKGSVPEVGMKFTSIEEIREHYLAYARSVGFPMRTRTTRKAKDGTPRSVTFVCSRQGNKKSKTQDVFHPRPTMQLGCEARVTASCDGDGIWKISVVQLLHNHGLSPTKSRIYRCNRSVPASVKKQLEVNEKAGIPLHKSFQAAVVEAGGYEELGFIEKDCRNYIEEFRRLRLGLGDAEAIQGYFNKMQAKNDGFFFSMDVDEESRLRNVFWVDNRCRQCYKSFGDVVTFDTTYLTNKYELRFAPFVGVNHHGQSVLLGCGLIAHEDTESFVWLFKTWLQCMDGVPPQGIITDQDQGMAKAISIVFPGIKHRWCLWHILNKLPEKLGGRFLPEKYILERWRRDVKRAYTRVKVDYDGWICTVEQQRYDDFCNSFRALANKVVDDEYRTKEIMDWIQKEMSVEAMRSKNPSTGVQEIPEHTTSTPLVLDPLIGTRKGAPRKSRLKSNREKCGQKKTRKRTTEKDPKPKEGRKKDNLPKKRKKMDASEILASQRQHAWPVEDEDGVYDLTLGGLDLGLSLQ